MNGYIVWINNLTDNYHSGGAVLIFADNLRDAKKMLNNRLGRYDNEVTSEEWKAAIRFKVSKPPRERLFIFPDGGCC